MEFSTLKEFRKVYEEVREDILTRHGYKKGDKVKLKNAVMLWQNLSGQWVKCSSVKGDMEDRIRVYEVSGKETLFKLTSLV